MVEEKIGDNDNAINTDEIAKIDEIDAMKTLFSKNKRNTDDIFNSFSRILSEFIPI